MKLRKSTFLALTAALAMAVSPMASATEGSASVFQEVTESSDVWAEEVASFETVEEEAEVPVFTEEVQAVTEQINDLQIVLPGFWRGRYLMETEGNTVWFVHSASRLAGAGGKLFGIALYSDESWKNLADAVPVTERNQVTYVWVRPEAVSYDLESGDEYLQMTESLQGILESVRDTSLFEEAAAETVTVVFEEVEVQEEVAASEVTTVDGKIYYVKDDGSYGSGWRQANGFWYFFDKETKEALIGRQMLGSCYYYFDEEGKMQTGLITIDGELCYFNADGKQLSGIQTVDGEKYCFRSAIYGAKKGWIQQDGIWYFFGTDYKAVKGFNKIGNCTYYFNNEGQMQTGWQTLDGKRYYFKSAGQQQFGVTKIDGKIYYFKETTGEMKTGWRQVGGKWYYFLENGPAVTGFYKIGGCVYYFDPETAEMQTGFVTVGGKTYYMEANGHRATGLTMTTDGLYNLDSVTGAGTGNGWVYSGGNKQKYIFKNGKVATGWTYVDGFKYYFKPEDGTCVQDVRSLLGTQTTYKLTVDRVKCVVTVYAYDKQKGTYCIPAVSFLCSVGTSSTPTPKGTFALKRYPYQWIMLMGPSWGQYGTHLEGAGRGGIYFHSVAGGSKSVYNVSPYSFNRLGSPASHGCIRLCVRDAKWIWENVPAGCYVTVGDNLAQPLNRPVLPKIYSPQNWDPTDPAVKK